MYVISGQECVEIITGGVVVYEIDGCRQEYEAGTIFWHVKGDHTVCESGVDMPFRTFVMWFSVDRDIRTVPHVSYWKSGYPSLEHFIEEVLPSINDEQMDRIILCEYLHRHVLWEAYSSTIKKNDTLYPRSLQRAMKLCNNVKNFTIGVPELARTCGISEPYLHELFLKYLKTTPHEYLLEKRMCFAKNCLIDSNESIKSIAKRCGFTHLESFHRAFKRHCGLTPNKYRQKFHYIDPHFPIYDK